MATLNPQELADALTTIGDLLGMISNFKHRLKDRDIYDAESTILATEIVDLVALLDS